MLRLSSLCLIEWKYYLFYYTNIQNNRDCYGLLVALRCRYFYTKTQQLRKRSTIRANTHFIFTTYKQRNNVPSTLVLLLHCSTYLHVVYVQVSTYVQCKCLAYVFRVSM